MVLFEGYEFISGETLGTPESCAVNQDICGVEIARIIEMPGHEITPVALAQDHVAMPTITVTAGGEFHHFCWCVVSVHKYFPP